MYLIFDFFFGFLLVLLGHGIIGVDDKVPKGCLNPGLGGMVYCGSGHRGSIVALGLRLPGWTNVINLGGGLGAWVAAQLPVEQ